MAKAIEDAIAALQYKGADYTKVDAAIAKANALNKDNYKNFSAVEDAVNAVVRGKNITEQDEVDAMAQAIEKAINDLVRRSSGSSRPRYDVTTPSKPENGSVTVDPERARSGSRVTVTVTPDSGYKLGELVVTDKDGKKLELTDKGNGQYTFTMPSGKVEVAAEFVKEVEVSPFADVATDAYYYDAVKWAVNKGITNGVSETLFGPDQACTRAQIVTFLWRAAGSPEPKSGSSFADVAADAYYAKAVAWAVENGITKGTSETTFHPDETCTRAQGVTFLYRALGKLAAAQAGFTDVAADSYYADAVNWAAENGVTKGISETLFGPDGSCTRAQIVTFLYRAYQGK
ncbi:S-layer homology domain-containing protein [Evtepia sp.]|uniref:S-layer homology domain-containing protein n=1 Tax=Evtepia sp. TaxID=2773933 RepID=UPI002E771E67|nr:S-layer homology domain-containing protein [Evtepia sp.]MEE0257296.1 S-layer homology domain-containing protein [Evtepia sp.]